MSKRAVLYARVSSDDRDKEGRNLKGQLDMCREYAEKHGWPVIAELAEDDRGASGAAMDLPKLNEVFDMAENGEFDVLVVRELDRLSRELAKQLYVEDRLKKSGVAIEYVLGDYDDTPEGLLMKNVRAVVAEYERLKITERMLRGRRQKVEAGNVMVHGRPPYGYRKIDDGETTSLAIVEEEAKVVRLIYQWYTIGDGDNGPLSAYAITKALTEAQIPTPGDKRADIPKKQGYGRWNKSTVARILTREAYCGIWYYGKRNRNRSNPQPTLIPVDVPAIVERDTWEAAQRQRAKNAEMSTRNQKHNYLLSRRTLCGTCGAKMHATARSNPNRDPTMYYHCPAPVKPRQYANECNQREYFRADEVEPAVWDWTKDLIRNPKTIEETLRQRHEYQEEANRPIRDALKLVEDSLAEANSQMDRLVNLYLTGEFSKEELSKYHTELEKRIRSLEKEQSRLEQQLDKDTISQDQIASLKAVARAVSRGLNEAEAHFETRRKIIDLLDVMVTLGVDDGHKHIDIACRMGTDTVPTASRITCRRPTSRWWRRSRSR